MKYRPSKRTLLMVLLLLIGGGIINVAVAWGSLTFDVQRKVVFLQMGDGMATLSTRLVTGGTNPEAYQCQWHCFSFDYTNYISALESDIQTLDQRWQSRLRVGWPWRSMQHEFFRAQPFANTRPDALTLHMQPIAGGFVGDTLTFAAMLGLLFAAPGFVRRRIRARRGQCPACAYPVGSSTVCTECGRPVTPRA